MADTDSDLLELLELDDKQRQKMRAKALRRIRRFVDEWSEVRSSSPTGDHTPISVHEVERYNMALNRLREAGETVSNKHYAVGPVVPKHTYVQQPEDGVPVSALIGKARNVLLRFDQAPASADQA